MKTKVIWFNNVNKKYKRSLLCCEQSIHENKCLFLVIGRTKGGRKRYVYNVCMGGGDNPEETSYPHRGIVYRTTLKIMKCRGKSGELFQIKGIWQLNVICESGLDSTLGNNGNYWDNWQKYNMYSTYYINATFSEFHHYIVVGKRKFLL